MLRRRDTDPLSRVGSAARRTLEPRAGTAAAASRWLEDPSTRASIGAFLAGDEDLPAALAEVVAVLDGATLAELARDAGAVDAAPSHGLHTPMLPGGDADADTIDKLLSRVRSGVVKAADASPEARREAETQRIRDEILADMGWPDARVAIQLDADLGDLAGESRPGVVMLGPAFDPFARDGRALLAHELAHEAQRGLPGAASVFAAEAEASAIMRQVLAGAPAVAPQVPLAPGVHAGCSAESIAQAAEEREDAAEERKTPEERHEPEEKPSGGVGGGPIPDDDDDDTIIDIPVTGQPPKTPELPKLPKMNSIQPAAAPEPEAHECETGCPEPLPEHTQTKPARLPPMPAPGAGEARTLTLGGHRIHFRLPAEAKPGRVDIRFREVDSPWAAVALKHATVTLSDDLQVQSGQLFVDVRLGKFVQVSNAVLSVGSKGQVTGRIRNARVTVGSKVSGAVDLDIHPDGVSGAGTFMASNIKLGAGLRFADGRLDVTVSTGGAVTAHGKLGLEVGNLGRIDLDACFVDGELRGELTANVTKPIPLPFASRVTRIQMKGCYADDAWSLHGELDLEVGGWASATVAGDLRRASDGALSWGIAGDVHQTKPLALGSLNITDTHLHVAYDRGEWAPATAEMHFRSDNFDGELKGVLDLAATTLDAEGDVEVIAPLALGPLSLTEGRVHAKVEHNALTTVEGAAKLELAMGGAPTFAVECTRALWDVKAGEVHAEGLVTVLRDLVAGRAEGLHATLPAGPIGTFHIEQTRLVHADAGVAVTVEHGAEAVGEGHLALDWSADAGLSGEATFGLTGRTGVPDHAAGPLFMLPGGGFAATLANGAFGEVGVRGVQWELVQPEGTGRVCGTLDGTWDFDAKQGVLAGQAWVQDEWRLAAPAGAPDAITGWALVLGKATQVAVKVGPEGLEAADLTLAARVQKGERDIAKASISGHARVDELTTLDGAASLTLVDELPIGQGAGFALSLGKTSTFAATIAQGRITGGSAGLQLVASELGGAGKAAVALDVDIASSDLGPSLQVSGGALAVLAPIALGHAGDFGLTLDVGSSGTADIVDGTLASASGALKIGLERDGVTVGNVALQAAVKLGETPSLDGQASVTITRGFTLFETGAYAFGFAPSTFSATFANGSLTQASGNFGLRAEQRGSDDAAPLGSIDVACQGTFSRAPGGPGKVSGKGSFTANGEFRVAQAGPFTIVLTGGSGAVVEIADNAFVGVHGALKARIDQQDAHGSGPFLELAGTVDYVPQQGGQVDASGRITVIGERRLFEAGGKSLWLAPGAAPSGASIVVQKNEVKHVDGTIGAELRDAAGPLLRLVVAGAHWEAATDELSGAATVTLMRDQGFPRDRASVVLKAGASGEAAVVKGDLKTFKGQGTVTVLDANGAPVVDVTAAIDYDVAADRLANLTGTASLARPIQVAVGGQADALVIESLNGSATITDGELAEVHGALAFSLPHLGDGVHGMLSGGWRQGVDGADATFWGHGELELRAFEDAATGRHLRGTVAVDVGEDGGWEVAGELDWALSDTIGGKVGVTMDEKLDPGIDIDLSLAGLTLLDAPAPFAKDLDLIPRVVIPAIPLISVAFGAKAGFSLGLRALTAGAHIATSETWHPLRDGGTVPSFEADLDLDWGADFHLGVAPYLEVIIGLPYILEADVGIEAELAVDVPIALKPSAHLSGGPDGLRGELDMSLSIAPHLSLAVRPYVDGRVLFFELGKTNLAALTVDLGEAFRFDWGTKYTFGDETGATPIAPGATQAGGGTQQQKKARHKQAPTFPQSAGQAPATKPGSPALEAAPGHAEGKPASGPEKELGFLDKLSHGLAIVNELVAAMSDYMATPEVTLPVLDVSKLMASIEKKKADWERVAAAGRKLFALAEEMFGPLRSEIPLWARLIIEAPPGSTPTFIGAWLDEDNAACAMMKANRHLIDRQSYGDRAQMASALMSGFVDGEDAGYLLTLLKDALRRGDYAKMVKDLGGAAHILKRTGHEVGGPIKDLLVGTGQCVAPSE